VIELDGKKFDWDRSKHLINISKHGISFKEAATVFQDKNLIEIDDWEHSQHNEDRFIIIGKSKRLRLLVVCHCFREKGNDTIIRIFSAREANSQEALLYGGSEE
jgi:uncharacterized DUF497 family protein